MDEVLIPCQLMTPANTCSSMYGTLCSCVCSSAWAIQGLPLTALMTALPIPNVRVLWLFVLSVCACVYR